MADPETIRTRTFELFQHFEELEQPESLLMPILMDAVIIVESYRRVRHQVLHLPELTRSVDALLKELEIIDRTNRWAADEPPAASPEPT